MKKIILIILFLSSCQKPPTHIVIDNSFSQTQLTQIKKSLYFWKNYLNLSYSIEHITIQQDILILNASHGWKKTKFEELAKTRNPIATTYNKKIFIPNLPTSHSYLFKIVAHELGHVFGCYHTNDESDIMYPFLSNKKQSVSFNCKSLIRKTF